MARVLRGASAAATDVAHGPIRDALAQRATRPIGRARLRALAGAAVTDDASAKQAAVARLVQVYANRGHLLADIDPLGLMKRPVPEVLELSHFGLSDADLDTEFYTGSRTEAIAKRMKLRDIIAQLRHIYCGTIGAEFAHVSDSTERLWLQNRFQEGRVQQSLLRRRAQDVPASPDRRRRARALSRDEVSGAEALLAGRRRCADPAARRSDPAGRARAASKRSSSAWRIAAASTCWSTCVGKSPQQLFSEFEGRYDTNHMQGSGDVKYHKGFSTDIRTPAGNVHVALAFNPSHLEVVNPVVEGSVRARQQRRNDAKGDKVVAGADPRRCRLRRARAS